MSGAGFVYVNSVSLAYEAEIDISSSLKVLVLTQVSRLPWKPGFALSFYRDKLEHFEDPIEAAVRNRTNGYWTRMPCGLFIGRTPAPQFRVESLYNYCLLKDTYVFQINGVSCC